MVAALPALWGSPTPGRAGRSPGHRRAVARVGVGGVVGTPFGPATDPPRDALAHRRLLRRPRTVGYSARTCGQSTREPGMAEAAVRAPGRTRGGRRAEILVTFTRHVAERGYDRANFGDVAAELGLSKGTIVHHFGTKDRM